MSRSVASLAGSDPILLETRDLTRAFGSLIAVKQVSIAVRSGELRSIIGPNGAGKTTFFRLVSGEMAPSSGTIRFGGRDITGLPQHAVARLGVGKSYQITNVFPHLSALENVRVAVQGPACARGGERMVSRGVRENGSCSEWTLRREQGFCPSYAPSDVLRRRTYLTPTDFSPILEHRATGAASHLLATTILGDTGRTGGRRCFCDPQ